MRLLQPTRWLSMISYLATSWNNCKIFYNIPLRLFGTYNIRFLGFASCFWPPGVKVHLTWAVQSKISTDKKVCWQFLLRVTTKVVGLCILAFLQRKKLDVSFNFILSSLKSEIILMESHDFRRVVTFEGSMLLGYASCRKTKLKLSVVKIESIPLRKTGNSNKQNGPYPTSFGRRHFC